MANGVTRRMMLAQFMAVAAGAAVTGSCAPRRSARPARAFDGRSGTPLGIQLYMLGSEAMGDPAAIFAELAAIGYREVELPAIALKSVAPVAAAAKSSGLAVTSLHLNSGRLAAKGQLSLESEDGQLADALGALGARQAVVSLMPVPEGARFGGGKPFGNILADAIAAEGADYWKRFADLLDRRAAALASSGIALGYHNHNIEFAPVGDSTGFDIMMRHLDPKLVHIELDVGWVATAGLDPAKTLSDLGGRVRQLHLKDVAAGTPVNFALETRPAIIGTGVIDWRAVLAAARGVGVRHAYVEQEPPFTTSRMEAARQSFAYLDALTL